MSAEIQANLESRAQKFLPLSTTAWYVLVALLEEPQHAYGVVKKVVVLSEGGVRLGTGSIYQHMRRYQSSGLIEEAGQASLSRRGRLDYRVTALGIAVVSAETRRMETMLRALDRHSSKT